MFREPSRGNTFFIQAVSGQQSEKRFRVFGHASEVDYFGQKRAQLKKDLSSRSLHIILSGQVQFQDKNKKFKTYLSSGDIVGEIGELKKFRAARAFAYSDDVYTVRLNQNELERVFKLFSSLLWNGIQENKETGSHPFLIFLPHLSN